MQHHGGLEKHRREWVDGAGVDDTGIVWSRGYAKSTLLQAYLECLNTVCHSKQRANGSVPRLQTKIVKMLTSKTKVSDCDEVYKLCLQLWDELSLALCVDKESQESQCGVALLPDEADLARVKENKVLIRLALLADFYRYQKEDLALNKEESRHKLCTIRSEVARFLANVQVLDLELQPPTATCTSDQIGATLTMTRNNGGTVWRSKKKRCLQPAKNARRHCKDSIKWSKFSFSARRKSYYSKLVTAFHMVKTIGHPMLTLNSEWGLSCYYKLAVAYTTDQPLEMAAACLPELRQAVDIVHSEQFQKLTQLKPECQMLLYAVLNCHINWVYHNHKQILLMPGQPSNQPPREEGDLRCSRCLKNQTFHSSEVKGNPRNIDVEFDFEQMKFGSSCCVAPMINVPLSTAAVNTCTFTDMKQMYTSCKTCKQPIFSEVLVDVETLYSRCVTCTSKGL